MEDKGSNCPQIIVELAPVLSKLESGLSSFQL